MLRRIAATPIVAMARKSSRNRSVGMPSKIASTAPATIANNQPTGIGIPQPATYDSSPSGAGSVRTADAYAPTMKNAATPKFRMPTLHWIFSASARIAKMLTVVRNPTVQFTEPSKVTSVTTT